MSTGLVILGALFLAYYAVMLLAGMDFSFVWLAGAVVCIGGGILWKYLRTHGQHLPPAVKGDRNCCHSSSAAAISGSGRADCRQHGRKGEEDLDYVIVLGAQVGNKAQQGPSQAHRQGSGVFKG